MTTQTEGSIYEALRGAFGNERTWPHDDATFPVWEMNSYHLVWSSTNGSASKLRGLWNAKKGNFAYPVVLLAPGQDESRVRVLGPQRPEPAREIPFDSALNLLLQMRTASPHEAASVLAREFGRLEESVAPGLRVKDLLTPHFVRERLVWPINKEKLESAVENLSGRINADTPWRTLFTQFGYRVERLQTR
ncbi:MAG: hypothetical protein OXC95_16615, partial [Dehalococcoidia bacterium]|nr:hypothetical protein [Dehalococcoidia bacterium]